MLVYQRVTKYCQYTKVIFTVTHYYYFSLYLNDVFHIYLGFQLSFQQKKKLGVQYI